ncbi:hypothetical protein [Actinomadura rupiterrae]|uniref:hypothetical protein n=1 Tax=Actinomadura rupiterrae TaxID=559627 RepID=UPI0020A381F2|nr:hypothetical protein [Actinomadura rupiterrae]MCP2336124.1 hypothetical protein [Actinomadura rupiterrae]
MTVSHTPPRPVSPDPSLWARLRAVLRGLVLVVAAVARPVLTAPGALLSAWLGIPPGGARRLGRRVADTYRLGYHGAREGDVIDEEEDR